MSGSQALEPGNRLLATLPAVDYQRLQPHLELVTLPLQQVIYEAGDSITNVYFPLSGIVSLVATLKDGSTMEVGLVGSEGMTGMPLLLGGMTKTHRAFVQLAGEAWRLKATVLQAEFDRGVHFKSCCFATFRHCLLRLLNRACAIGFIQPKNG